MSSALCKIKGRQRPTLPQRPRCSTIGAGGLNDRVRDGIGWTPSALTTYLSSCRTWKTDAHRSLVTQGHSWQAVAALGPGAHAPSMEHARSKARETREEYKPNGRLVRLSSTCCHASTWRLSTSSSSTDLQGEVVLREASRFRCFQRLSRPHVAPRPCRWRDNRCTRDAFTPVLSY